MENICFGMNSTKRKRNKKGELPKRYRCRDKYSRALDSEINKFVSKPTTDPESDTATLVQDTR